MSTSPLKKNRFVLSGSNLLQEHEPPLLESSKVKTTKEPSRSQPQHHELPCGHTLNIDFEHSHVSIDAPDGTPTIQIQLLKEGPVVEVAGARLSLSSPKDINIACENFSLEAENDVYMNAQKSLVIESTQDLQINCEVDVHIRANVIWLN